MTAINIIMKAAENLRTSHTLDSSYDYIARKKEKISHCVTIMDGLSLKSVKDSSKFSQALEMSIETFLMLCDDPDADIRTVADESLNKIIKALNDGSIRKVQIHLYREIKRNGNARSLIVAITKFGLLSHMIWPMKGKAYVSNLIPCIIAIVKRTEQSVIESLANSLPLIFKYLGIFMTDRDVQILLNVFFENICSPDAVFRRCAASMVLTICLNCRKPQYYLQYVVNWAVDALLHLPTEDERALSVIGIFGCLKVILPHITFTAESSLENDSTLNRYLQIYQLCLHYTTWQTNHNVINAALETLAQYLQSLPNQLATVLLCPEGIKHSKIEDSQKRETALSIIRLDFLSNTEENLDISLRSLDLDTADINPKVEKWIEDSEKELLTGHKKILKSETTKSDIIKVKGKALGSYNNLAISFLENEEGEESSDDTSDSQFETTEKMPDFTSLHENDQEEEWLESTTTFSATSPQRSLAHTDIQKVDIGSIQDTDIPLKYCCRYLVSSFLLSGIPNQIVSDKISRVSVKSLALNCVGHIFKLCPTLFFESLAKDAKDDSQQMISDLLLFTFHQDPQIRGNISIVIGSFLKAILLQHRGSFKELESTICTNHSNTNSFLENLMQLTVKGLKDDSAVTCRQTLIALSIFLKELLESEECKYATKILDILPQIAKNPYFLVKIKLTEVLCNLPYVVIEHVTGGPAFQENSIFCLIELLGDRDLRVRHAASTAIIRMIPSLYYHELNEDPITWKAFEYVEQCSLYIHPLLNIAPMYRAEQKFMVNSLVEPFQSLCKANDIDESYKNHVNNALSRIIGYLIEKLAVSTSKYLIFGCVEALSRLSEIYLTTIYPKAWNCFLSSKHTVKTALKKNNSNSNTNENSSFNDGAITLSEGLMSLILTLLSSSPMSLDLLFHRNLLLLIGNLASGMVAYNNNANPNESIKIRLENSKVWGYLRNKKISQMLDILLTHIVRILNIYVHVIDGIQLTQSTVKPSFPSLSTGTQSLSPKRKFVFEQKSREKYEKTLHYKSGKEKLGVFSNIPHYIKMYTILKAAHANYSVTLDSEASEMYLSLLNVCLEVLSQLLEIATMNNSTEIIEEILHYLHTTVTLASVKSVQCVQQLLKSLFSVNLIVRWDELEIQKYINKVVTHSDNESNEDYNKGFYNRCLQKLNRQISETIKVIGNNCRGGNESNTSMTGFLNHNYHEKKMVSTVLTSCPRLSEEKTSMESSIRLFEPMVIKSLTQYTITQNNSVSLQCQVLKLLTQLVQLHINYCLLDSENIFINFVLNQFEFIEEGYIPQTKDLLPRIFDFLVYLSYEKYHTKVIISTPKIIQLCDGLMASGQPLETHFIPALVPVVEDIFIERNYSSNKAENKELETMREFLISMLLRLVEYHRVIELLVVCLTESKFSTEGDREEKWRRWSRLTIDAILPALAAGKVHTESKEAFAALVKLCAAVSPTVFRPVDPLLKVLFTTLSSNTPQISELNRWLGTINVVILTLISCSKEEAMLARLRDFTEHKSDIADLLLSTDSFQRLSDPPNTLNMESCQIAPERILATFIFKTIHLVSEAISTFPKYANNEMSSNSLFISLFPAIYSVSSNQFASNTYTYLINQFSLFLQLCIHMFESGSHCKIAHACMQIIREQAHDIKQTKISISNLSTFIFNIGTISPIISSQWIYIMTLLGHNEIAFWSTVLRTRNYSDYRKIEDKEVQTCTLNYNTDSIGRCIIRKSGIILLSDYICENNLKDSDLLTWFILNYIEDIVNLMNESPILELIAVSVHRDPATSGMLIEIVLAKCLNSSTPSYIKNLLRCLQGAHHAQSGALILAIVQKLLIFKHLALFRMAVTIACRRIEILLTLNSEHARKQLSVDNFMTMVSTLQSKRLEKKYSGLISLLNKLGKQHYGILLSNLKEKTNLFENPVNISNEIINRDWFISQVKQRCCMHSNTLHFNGCWESAQLLSNLDVNECIDIFSCSEFNMKILRECILLGARKTVEDLQANKINEPVNSKSVESQESSLYSSARYYLLQQLRNINHCLPKTHYSINIFFITKAQKKGIEKNDNVHSHKENINKYWMELSLLLEDNSFMDTLFNIIPCVISYLKTLEILSKYDAVKIDNKVAKHLAKFAILCLEVVYYIIYCYETNEEKVKPYKLKHALKCADSILKESCSNKVFNSDIHYSWVCTAAATLTKVVEHFVKPYCTLPIIQSNVLENAFEQEETRMYAQACLQMASLILWMEKSNNVHNFVPIPTYLLKPVQSLIVIVSRSSLVNSFILIPPLAWNFQYSVSGMGPTKCSFTLLSSESNLLHEIEILEQFIYRVTLLGWTCRLQFEEIWMALLGVLDVSQQYENKLCDKKLSDSGHINSLAVQALTRLLLQTLLLPCPGNPNNSTPIHISRDSQLPLHKYNYSKLYELQDILLWKHEYVSNFENNYKLKLETIFNRENIECIKTCNEYEYGQLPVSYLRSSCGIQEDKPGSLVYAMRKQRNNILTLESLDLDSCLQFLLELYTAWTNHQDKISLRLLNEIIKSLISVSELFVKRSQFQWMLEFCLEILHIHPPEDEILYQHLVFAVCKAASVLAPLSTEMLEKVKYLLEASFKSSFLPIKIAVLHGTLYLMQSYISTNCKNIINILEPAAIEYIQKHINIPESSRVIRKSEEHQRILWALVFYIIEYCKDSPLSSEPSLVLERTFSLITTHKISTVFHQSLLHGLERLVAARRVDDELINKIVKVAVDRLKQLNPSVSLPALQLLLTCMYIESADKFNQPCTEEPLPDIEPDTLVQAIERTSTIFDRIKKGYSAEIEILCTILSGVLNDFFPTHSILTKVISEFLSPQQLHPSCMSAVVFKVCEKACNDTQLQLLQEWVLFSLPNFIESLPVITSTWFLSCFFISLSTNQWLRALFPHVQSRIGKYEDEDRRILCIAASDFFHQLSNDLKKQTFIGIFKNAAEQTGTPFSDILACFISNVT